MRRTYSRFQTVLYPDTIFFLGDLFDGGREWSTRTTTSPEKQYRRYGDDFWMNEYRRFGNLFFKHWGDGGMAPRPGQPGRKIISSLPGNHDLGFARGVQTGVRDRFSAYFGDGNRIDVIANHTFVSIDSLSLSALGQDSPQQVENIWRPTKDFLENAKRQKKRLIQRELRVQQGLRPYPGFSHTEIPLKDLATSELPHANDDVTSFPTILLSHIPLYRAPGTPCGPLREHWPPTSPPAGQAALDHDDRNAIAVRGGYQYQNVMNREITADIAEKVGDIRYAFSGDDHDYCEVVHKSYPSAGGGIREITVKSISWAMGVRRPGIVLVSLWNPVDEHGNPKSGDASQTVQTHLCLLPDQIGTFLRYGMLFGITFLLLVLRATLVSFGVVSPTHAATSPSDSPILPTTTSDLEKDASRFEDHAHSSNSSSSSERAGPPGTLQVRSSQARTRSISPSSTSPSAAAQKYTYPLVQHAGFYNQDNEDGEERLKDKKVKVYGGNARTRRPGKKRKGLRLWWYEVRRSLGVVVGCGGVWYLWLVWRG